MLRQIQVSGFKSLENFDLQFRPGLNVIIGPNGSGKTNIINFIEFLSYLSRDSLLDAVGRSGGAGRIFRRNYSGALTKQICFRVSGEGEYLDVRFTRGNKARYRWSAYELSAAIELSENNSSIYYLRQRLKLAFNRQRPDNWEFDLEINTGPDDKTSIEFHKFSFGSDEELNSDKIKEVIEQMLSEHGRNRSIHQLIEHLGLVPGIVILDFLRAKSFNISPAIVRMPEDIASEPEIAPDGGGLAATLFALKNERRAEEIGSLRFYRAYRGRYFKEPEKMMDKIISYSKVVNDSIQQIEVLPDPVEAKLRITLRVAYEGGVLSLPFGLVSDGTAKWFTLVTAIVTSSSVFVLEEPENFLHPLMQKEIVRILRNTFTLEGAELFALMTTHSETILNCIDPEEMILVHMEDGKTFAKRPSNAEDIRAEIKSTGFGAGYYYIAGAIE